MSATTPALGSKVDVYSHYAMLYMARNAELVALAADAVTVRFVYGGQERTETFPLFSRTLIDWQRPDAGVREEVAHTVEAAGSDVAGAQRMISLI